MSFSRNNVLLLVMGLILVGLLAWGAWLLPQFSVQNNSSLAQYQISYLSAATYMWRSGYWPDYNRVQVVYTDQEQEVYRLLNQDSTVLTLGANRQGKKNCCLYSLLS